jgi:hypothetical protein
LIKTLSFHAGRTIADTGYGATAWSCEMIVVGALGECSPSRSSQSKPEPATISAL